MGIVSVVMKEEERTMFQEYAKEMSLSLSTAVRTLAIQQLRYQNWVAAGKPGRKGAKKKASREGQVRPEPEVKKVVI